MATYLKDMPLGEYIRDVRDQYETGQITRQEFLRWGAMLGASLPLLAAWAPQSVLAAERSSAGMTPQRGGTLRCTSFQPTTVEPAHLTDVGGAATVHLVNELVSVEHATYTRNPHYWHKPLPYLDGLRITYVKSGTAELNQLISGQSDVQLFTDPTQIRTLARSHKVKLLTARSAVYYEVYGRTDRKPFSDNRVREAFKYMVNRQQLVKIVYSGYGDLGNDNMVAPVYPEFTSNGVRE